MEHVKLVASRRFGTRSPLRYPGGKAALAGLFADLLEGLGLRDACYVEPYAGGAGAGVSLLQNGLVSHLVINDLDPAVFAFWHSIVNHNEEFAKLVESVPLSIAEWLTQREIYRKADETDPLRLGFAFFYLNRTNRSGVLRGGVIGGLQQTGEYKMDARFNRETLIARVRAIGQCSDAISVTNLDGRSTILQYAPARNTFLYIDPPYVEAGSQLYLNAFDQRDHRALAEVISNVSATNWLLTYDVSPFIENLYRHLFQRVYSLNYSARNPGKADELLIASATVAPLIKEMECSSAASGGT